MLNNESVTNVLNILKARAEFDGTPRNLHLRVAKVPTEPHTIFCDLTNKEWHTLINLLQTFECYYVCADFISLQFIKQTYEKCIKSKNSLYGIVFWISDISEHPNRG